MIVSAGFDYVAGESVGDLGVGVEAAAPVAAAIRRAAEEYCGGSVAYVLEGGYDIDALDPLDRVDCGDERRAAGAERGRRSERAAAESARTAASVISDFSRRPLRRIRTSLLRRFVSFLNRRSE